MPRHTVSIVDLYSPELPFVTEFLRLLHKVRGAKTDGELKTLLFTSAMISEGKSTVCSFLGITAALQKGMRTLVVDCDLRRPAIHKFFASEIDPGLSDILIEGYSPKDATKKTGIDKLDIITAGKKIPLPTEVFDAEAIGHLLDEMKFYYDLILVDCAPLLPVSDPMLLAPKMDGIVLVVKAGTTQSEIVSRAVEILESDRDKILGVVLNNMNNTLPYYYDYNYYGYEYGELPRKKLKPTVKKNKKRSKKNSNRTTTSSLMKDSLTRPT